MKFKILMMLLFVSSNTFAVERFYRAEENQILIQGSYFIRQMNIDYKSKYSVLDLDDKLSSNAVFVEGEYGLTSDLAVGVQLNSQQNNSSRGIGDYRFNVKWQYESLFTEASYFYSHEKLDEDNVTSGGNSFSLTVGYVFDNNLGLRLTHTPEYDYEFKDDETDYVSGVRTQYEAFYEFDYDKNLYGVALGYTTSKSNKEDGEPNGFDSKYVTLVGYSNIKYMSLEFIPSVTYFSFVDIDSDATYDSFTILDLTLSARYRF